ncbi:MAG: preprotein translocase subunit YajC [Bacteroidota bacterium]
MLNSLLLLLMASPPGDGNGGGGGLIGTIIMFGTIIAIFWFMILRPQQKKQKQHQQMIDALKKGDKVVMSGGLHGTIAGLDEKTILVQVADNVKMKFDKGAIASVVREGEAIEKKDSK